MKLNRCMLSAVITTGVIGLATALWADPAHAKKCPECGVVSELKTVKKEGEGSGVGAIAGGVVGGVLGHQVGGGRGKDVATVAGAAGGAYVGHQMEKKSKTKTEYQVLVKMEEGNTRTFTFGSESQFRVGDKVKIVNGKLQRQ
ncbi:MAG: glycine zipper 2TM domain-containing protein [Betaproteobacteria bacterium]|nr:glycine zipper 2TM domain-containing protein [Betaproteobacteria bacterium]